ncbi:MAG TPA: allantoinase AllB [Chthoniobacterales bacterium]|nr:allantoinase AllB [Chthoniobacterales bacterium]
MTDFDLLVRGGEQDLGISAGKFAALGPDLSGSAAHEIDARGFTVFPGVIDAHVHFNEPGRTDWEGFATGSRAAAAGGTTTVFDMPLNAHPPTTDRESFELKRGAAEASSLVDFGLWGGLVPGNLADLEALRDCGVVGLKAFMCNSGISDFAAVDEAALRAGVKQAAALDLLVAVHAELEAMTSHLTGAARAENRSSVRDYLRSRPIAAELEAIRLAIEIAGETGCRLHIVHVSCGSGVALVAEARARGVDVTCETCPHYLVLTEDNMERLGAIAKCAPPLRSSDDQAALRDRLSDITTIGSDHSPAPPEMKQQENFFDVWGGISGCQHLLPLLIEAGLPTNEICRLTSFDVARRFRIPGKSGIEIGNDADFSLVALDQSETVTAESLHYRHKQSPYVGRTLRTRVHATFLRGQMIFQDGKFGARPFGRLVTPEQHSTSS